MAGVTIASAMTPLGRSTAVSPENTLRWTGNALASRSCASIKLSRECPVGVMRKEPVDLMDGDPCGGEMREFLPTEERYRAGFMAGGCASSHYIAQKECLIGVEQHRRVPMFVPIIQRHQLADLRLKARLLPYFTHHRLCRGLPSR